MSSQSGFSPIVIIAGAGAFIVILSSLFFLNQQKTITPSPSPSIMVSPSPSEAASVSASIKPVSVNKKPSTIVSSTPKASSTPMPSSTPSQNLSPTPKPSPSPGVAQIESMTINGGAYININASGPVPAGTLINAYINAVPCGSTTARDSSLINFTMEIHSASEVPGCGTPGATIQFWVDNKKALQTMPYQPGKYEGNVILNVSY